jgi:autotransporter adhesin
MNQSFRVIFQAASGTYVAVSELTKSKGKTKSSRALRHAAVATMLALGATSAMAGETCVTADGQNGTLDLLGACMVPSQSQNMSTRTIGVLVDPDGTNIQFGAMSAGGSAGARSDGLNSVAIGRNTNSSGDNSTGVGFGASATGLNSSVLGVAAHANGVGATALGFGANAFGNASIAIGGSQNAATAASATAGEAIAIGENSRATIAGAVALGGSANATGASSVALGQGSVADQDNVVSIGTATSQRKIINVAAGTADTDAANFGQLKATGASIATALGGGSVVNTDGTITTPIYTLLDGSTVTGVGGVVNNFDQRVSDLATSIGDGTVGLVQQDAATRNISVAATTGGTSVDFTGMDGARSLNGVANGVIAAGSLQAINGGQLFQMQMEWDQKLQDLTTGPIGDFRTELDRLNGQVSNQGDRLDAIEKGIEDGTIGAGTTNPENGNSQIGTGAIASGKDATAIGNGAIATGDNSTATGTNSSATGSNSTATGAGSIASDSNSTANGANAKATGENSTALGANSSATGSNSVAIGEGSVADRDNSVSFGSAGNERQLTNVADGTAPTDAVNKRQLDGAIAGVNDRIDRLDTRVDEMGAMSSAQAQMAMSTAGLLGNNRLGVGIGAQNGQSALALGYQRVYGQGTRTLSFGGAASTRGTVSFGAGAGFAW